MCDEQDYPLTFSSQIVKSMILDQLLSVQDPFYFNVLIGYYPTRHGARVRSPKKTKRIAYRGHNSI